MDNKKTLVVGMARSGIAAAKMLMDRGALVRITDVKLETELDGSMCEIKHENVEWRLGERAEDMLTDVDCVVISPGIPIDHTVVKKAKEKGIEVVGELELAYRYAQGTLIAITGTNGKTTTTTLTGEIFKNAGRRTYVVGNIGYPYSAVAASTRADDVVVCEVSSFQLESIVKFHPSVAVVLNITEDHLNRHGTMDKYTNLKARVFENQTSEDFAVLNYDDPDVRGMSEGIKGTKLWFSRQDVPPMGAFVENGALVFGTPEKHRTICNLDEISIPGPHNLENAMAATCIAMAKDVPPPVIRHSLRTFAGVEHRIEFVRELDGVRYINDSKGTNIDSTLKAMQTMTVPTVILLGGSEKGVDMRPLAEALKGSTIIHAVLIGETAEKIAKLLDGVGFAAYEHAGYSLDEAVNRARAKAVPGGNVLLSPACASFDMFKDCEHRGKEFKRIVNELRPGDI